MTKHSFSDVEDPIVESCPTNQSLNTSLGQPTAVVNWINPEASDNSRTEPTVTCSVESGSKFGIGENEVKCQAFDPAGNYATCLFIITVKGNWLYIVLDIHLSNQD